MACLRLMAGLSLRMKVQKYEKLGSSLPVKRKKPDSESRVSWR
ncbi:hypothetical protein [Siphonobacter sp.]